MRSESKLTLEIWELVREQIAPARRQDIATSLLQAFEEFGFEDRDLQDVIDEDPHLTRAFHEVFEYDIAETDEEESDDE